MAGKGSIPLFEALQRSSRDSGIAMHRPAIPPLEPKKAGRTGVVRVPSSAIYMAATIVLGLLIAVWAVAFEIGRRAGEDATLRKLGLVEPEVRTDPIEELINGDLPDPIDRPILATPAPPLAPRILLPEGPSTHDPRMGQTNYLKLASGVSEEESRGAISFLAEHGIRAMARLVGDSSGASVDEPPGPRNNPARYDLFALEPVPSNRYGELRKIREDLEREVARLGQIWRKPPHRGTVDFAQSVWVKFEGER